MEPLLHSKVSTGAFWAVASPTLAVLAASAISAVFAHSSVDALGGIALVTAITFFVAAIGVLALGIPILLLLRWRKRLYWHNVLVASALAGCAYLGLILWLLDWRHEVPSLPELFSGAIAGAVSGLGFCLGARPNNSSKPTPLRGAA